MNFRLNNSAETVAADTLSIAELLEIKKYSFKMLIVKINDRIIKRDEYPAAFIKEGDEVLVLHLMSGG